MSGFSRPAKRSSGIWCVAAATAESSEGVEAEEPPRIKLPSCEAAAAMEMARKERTIFMMISSRYFVDVVYAQLFVFTMIGLLIYFMAGL